MVEPIAEPTGETPYESLRETRSGQGSEAAGPDGPAPGEQAGPDEAMEPATPRIVVGVDGSEPSLHALRWAARQAALTGASLEAVIAWEMPSLYGTGMIPGIPEGFDLEDSAANALSQAVETALPPEQAAAVVQTPVLGNAAQAILDRGEGAELIVVGVRGHGTFRSTLLGSVSHTVTLHADCPVVVVRGKSA